MAVSKRTRFEVLRRDGFACKYCGAKAPDVRLQVDHVNPTALGGNDDPSNLATACQPCNSGKASTAGDEAMIADVSRAALVWSRAMALAAERKSYDQGEHSQLLDYFECEWAYGGDDSDDARDSMSPDWRSSVISFYTNGLRVTELDEAIAIAQSKSMPWDARWRYFCGICWNKVHEIQREARRIIASGEVS